MGNTLERPQVLLKRTENRDTNFDQEKLEKDKEFASLSERVRCDEAPRS